MLSMSRVALLACILCVGASFALNVDVATTSSPEALAAQGTLCRVIPDHCHQFSLHIEPSLQNPKNPGNLINAHDEAFVVKATNGTVSIFAASGVGLTSGAYWYLKNVTKCQVTWGEEGTGDQLNLPSVLPDVPSTMINSTVPWRYSWNMCTFSYSAAFWDWARWERELDWMALHGVNLPLALTGQEFIWVDVFQKLGVSLDELESWFTGPAFLAWQRAGNIRKFAGPLSKYWIDSQKTLQQQILKRARSLGMTPILPCFAGHVPKVTKRLFPNATITASQGWNHFPPEETDVYYLDPTDSLYTTIGKLFMESLVEYYGESHYYSCDTFNEVNPTSTNLDYLKNASAAVLDAIATVDKQGVWVMQAWLFHNNYWDYSRVQAYLSGVPNDKMLILDLNSEAGTLAPQYDQYFGKPWVWCMLHNYGGVRGVYGNLTDIATNPFVSLYTPGSTMLGIGFTPEAIEQNPVMYEMLTTTFWGQLPLDAEGWLMQYVTQRYGTSNEKVLQAWRYLFNAVYNQPGEARSEIEWVPHWQDNSFGWQNGDATGMHQAWEALLEAVPFVPNAANNGPFQYDFVDITRQATTMFFSDVHRVLDSIGESWSSGSQEKIAALEAVAEMMKTLIRKIDDLLGTNPNYMLGLWTTRATNLANQSDPDEIAMWLYNAKNQITMWGPNAQIDDYAAKAWHGLYGTYYHARWSVLLDGLVGYAKNSSLWDFNSYQYTQDIFAVEYGWDSSNQTFSPTPKCAALGNCGQKAFEIAQEIHGLISNDVAITAYSPQQNMMGSWNTMIYESPVWTRNPKQLAILCNLMGPSQCQGFDSEGNLYSSTTGATASQGITLYSRQ